MVREDTTPRTIRIPTKYHFDVNHIDEGPFKEVPTTTLTSLGKVIGHGGSGVVYLMKRNPSIVLKLVSTKFQVLHLVTKPTADF